MNDGGPLQQAVELLSRHPLIDGHNDLAWAARQLSGYDLDRLALHEGRPELHTDLPRLAAGRLGGQFWSVYVPSALPAGEAVAATLEQIDFVHRLIARYPDRFAFAGTAAELRQAFRDGRVASLIGAEGGHCIGGSLAVLRMFHQLGVRYLTLTHFRNVDWADSATDVTGCGGLTDFGRQVVAEMNRLGVIVDLAHVSEGTMGAALDATVAPVIFSHSCARSLIDHPRNVPDRVLRRLPANGGVCMVAFVPDFLSAACYEWRSELSAWLEAAGIEEDDEPAAALATASFACRNPRPQATTRDVADHIDRVREVAGVDHVGIGADYDGCDVLAAGLGDVSGYPSLFAELFERGWSAADCAKLAGGNVLRVLQDVEAAAG
jgi:membrane dipeptidase